MKLVRVMTPDSANSLATSPMRRMFSSRSAAAQAGRVADMGYAGAQAGDAWARAGMGCRSGRTLAARPNSDGLVADMLTGTQWDKKALLVLRAPCGGVAAQPGAGCNSAPTTRGPGRQHSASGPAAAVAPVQAPWCKPCAAPVKPRLLLRPCRTLSPSSSTVILPRSARACSSVHATVLLPLPLRPGQ